MSGYAAVLPHLKRVASHQVRRKGGAWEGNEVKYLLFINLFFIYSCIYIYF